MMRRRMKAKAIVAFGILVLFALGNGLVYAAELKGSTGGSLNALNSGYAITRWPWDGGEVLPGDDATVRACTTKTEAVEVVFRWHRPDGSSFDVGPVPLTLSSDTWDGQPIYDASDTQTLYMVGDWGVQALFLDEEGKLQGPNPYPIIKIKATSWHVIPELPLGTILALAACFSAAAVLKARR